MSVRSLAVVVILIGCSSSKVNAQLTFDLIDESNESLATVTFAKLPTNDVNDITSLTFSDKGQSIFDLGPTYQGTFDAMSWHTYTFVVDQDDFGRRGLGGVTSDGLLVAGAIDYDPPGVDGWFQIGSVHTDLLTDQNDYLVIGQFDSSGQFHELRAGNRWILVPNQISQYYSQ